MPMKKLSSPIRRKRIKVARDSHCPAKSRETARSKARTKTRTPIRAPLAPAPCATLSPPRSQAASQPLTGSQEPPSYAEKPRQEPQADRLAQYPRQAVPNPPRSLEGEKLNQNDSTQLQQPDSIEPRGDIHPFDMSHLEVLCAIAGLDRQQHDLVVNDKNTLAQLILKLLANLVVSEELCTVMGERISRLEALLDVETDGCWRDIEKEQATRKHSLKRRVEDWLRGIQEA